MPAIVKQFPCLSDNYGLLIHDTDTGATAAIDAPDGAPVLAALSEMGWTLTDILVTHRHFDHVQGIPALLAAFPKARVVAPAKEADKIGVRADLEVCEHDVVRVGALGARVIETPGHTIGHIVYWFESEDILFAGDTLFSIGCGRVNETPMDVMWASLQKIAALPQDTQIYCGHEYTQANARFALTIDPNNDLLKQRAIEVADLRANNHPTLPTTLELELAINPFLRADDDAIRQTLGLKTADAADVFGEIRLRKNRA